MVIVADASILIAHLRGVPAARRFLKAQDEIITPTFAAWELWTGARQAGSQAAVRGLLEECTVEPFSASLAEAAGTLQREREGAGKRRPAVDILIAAHAVVRRCPLATLDRDYDGIAGLEIVRVKG
jgi:predicted nucleic acid-binding protein